MIVYEKNKNIKIQNKIINFSDLIKILKHYYSLYIDFEDKFQKSQLANAHVEWDKQFYEYYKYANELTFYLNRSDGYKGKYLPTQFDYVMNELKNNIDLYDSISVNYSVQYIPNYQNVQKEYVSYSIDFSVFPDGYNEFEINTSSQK